MNNDFLFERFVEDWASIYVPMKHERKNNERFFVTDSYYSLIPLIEGTNPDKSPIVVVESGMEGRVDERFDYPEWTVYFLCRAKDMRDGRSAVRAKREAKNILFDFRNMLLAFKKADPGLMNVPMKEDSYLYQLRQEALAGKPVLQHLDLNINYDSVGILLDGWQGVFCSFSHVIPYNFCIDYTEY